MKQEIYKTPFVTVFHNQINQIMEVYWTAETKHMTSNEFREHVSVYANLALEYHTKGIFIDTYLFETVISVEDQTWHDDVIVSQYKEAGVKKMAFLKATDIFGQASHEMVFDEIQAKRDLEVRFFDTEETAKSWLW